MKLPTVTRTSGNNLVVSGTNTILFVGESRVNMNTVQPVSIGKQLSESLILKQFPGLKELRERVTKFSGDGKKDFEFWLTDYCEVRTDQLRASWFSWFLIGAAVS